MGNLVYWLCSLYCIVILEERVKLLTSPTMEQEFLFDLYLVKRFAGSEYQLVLFLYTDSRKKHIISYRLRQNPTLHL